MGRLEQRRLWASSRAGAALFSLAAVATLGIWCPDPFMEWGYEFGVFSAAACLLGRQKRLPAVRFCAPLAVIGCWGVGQLLLRLSQDGYSTFQSVLRAAALAATAMAAAHAFRGTDVRRQFLKAMAWFGFVLSLLSILAYYTSPGKVLWLFGSPYPDAWGPFLSRNNFAEFLEICVPVALWRGLSHPQEEHYLWMAAVMLAAGLASASRAGVVLLTAETGAAFLIAGKKQLRWFLLLAGLMGIVAATGTLRTRMRDKDPFEYRREIFRSAAAMIQLRPLAGYGLGTFGLVYPEFAKFDAGASVDHAHSDWLEWTAEGGVLFSAAWIVLALALWRPSVRSVWGIGVPAAFVHALVDHPFARLGVAAWIFLCIGMVMAADAVERSKAAGPLSERS